jgi:hypothetical protein
MLIGLGDQIGSRPCRIVKLGRSCDAVRPTLAELPPSGPHGESARPFAAIGAYELRYTTKQPSTHNTESRKLLHPW